MVVTRRCGMVEIDANEDLFSPVATAILLLSFLLRLTPQPQFPGLSPHVVTYYTMGTALVTELTQALQCFVNSLVADSQESETGFDGNVCKRIR